MKEHFLMIVPRALIMLLSRVLLLLFVIAVHELRVGISATLVLVLRKREHMTTLGPREKVLQYTPAKKGRAHANRKHLDNNSHAK